MHLTALPTRCSIRVWKITRKRLWNLTNILQLKKLAVNTIKNSGIQKGFVILAAIITTRIQRIRWKLRVENFFISFSSKQLFLHIFREVI